MSTTVAVRSTGPRALVRLRQVTSLLKFVPRVGRWSVVPATTVLGAGMLGSAALFTDWGAGTATSTLQLAAVALAAATGFALDDPAAVTVAASPLTLRVRRSLAVAGVFAAAAVAWALLVALAGSLLDDPAASCLTLVRGALSWEAGWLFATVAAIAVLVGRRTGTTGGTAAAVAVVLVYVAAHHLPTRWSLLTDSPLNPTWPSAQRHLVVATVVVGGLTIAVMSDPWRRRRRLRTAMVAGITITAAASLVIAVPRPAAALDVRLDATLDDVVGAQGIDHLRVVVRSPEGTWERTVGAPSEDLEVGLLLLTRTGRPYASTARPVIGASDPDGLDDWTRGLAHEQGDLEDRVTALGAPPGTTWAPPDPRAPRPVATTEVRWVPDRDLVITVMTGDHAAPCGTAVADALLAQILA